MKSITLIVQIKMRDDTTEEKLDDILHCIETPVEDDDGPLDHLDKYGYEVMILDRSDKNVITKKR